MGTRPLGLKLTRRIARDVGKPIKRAVGHGGYEFSFVTFDHEHGWWNKRDGSWSLVGPGGDDGHPVMHWSSCSWNFPHDNAEVWQRRREQAATLAQALDVPLAVVQPGLPEGTCGATADLDGLALICDLTPEDHKRGEDMIVRHVCGSETWWTTTVCARHGINAFSEAHKVRIAAEEHPGVAICDPATDYTDVATAARPAPTTTERYL